MCRLCNKTNGELQMRLRSFHSQQRKRTQSSMLGPLMLALTVVAAGCATNRQDLVRTGHLTVQRHATGKVQISWCSAYEKDSEFLVMGALRHHDTVGMPIPVCVDVRIVAPDGHVLDEACSSIVRVPRRTIGRHTGFRRFTVRFSEVPPPGSSLAVVASSNGICDSANADRL